MLHIVQQDRTEEDVRWFKHMNDMLEDEWVKDVLMAKYKLEGYGFLCGIYEIYCKQCGDDPGSEVVIPIKTITRKLQISETKVTRMLHDCATAVKLSFNFCGKNLHLQIPRMAQLRDNYTKNLQVTGNNVSPKKQKKKKKEDKKEKNIKKKKNELTPGFKRFWEVYPKKLARQDALEAWYNLDLEGSVSEVVEGVVRYLASQEWDNPQYVPYPATFLRGYRWEDELDLQATPEEPFGRRLLKESDKLICSVEGYENRVFLSGELEYLPEKRDFRLPDGEELPAGWFRPLVEHVEKKEGSE